MANPIKRVSEKGPPKRYTTVSVRPEVGEQLTELAHRENTSKAEIVRYLIELAYEGKIGFEEE